MSSPMPSMPPAKPLLYLIDGSSQMYRAFHAPIRTMEGTLLRNSLGQPTNAVYIFVTMLRKLIKEQSPEFIAASFDLPGRTFRDDLAADYKANRRPMPDELAPADSARPPRVRGARRADHHAGTLRGRRCDRHDDRARGRRGLRRRDRHRRQRLLPAGAGRHSRLQPARRRHAGTTPPA